MKRFLLLIVTMCACHALMAQSLSGLVTKDGKPKKNVVVWLKNTDARTMTDKEGKFAFDKIESSDTLVISASNSQDAKFFVSGVDYLTVNLEKKEFVLNTGGNDVRLAYTKVGKVGGSGLTHDRIMKSGMHTIFDLVKLLPGVQVMTDKGERHIMIRGRSSLKLNSDVLFVVDGVSYESPSEVESIVNVESIEKMEVHKDGSEWGVRGANGVITIKTLGGGF